LREELAAFGEWLANGHPPWAAYRAFMACRLVALDKGPGVRPVGIREVIGRLWAKCSLKVSGHRATVSCGSGNLCAGLPAGIEGALHAMEEAPTALAQSLGPTQGGLGDGPPPEPDGADLLTQPPDMEVEPSDLEDEGSPFIRLLLDATNGFNELGRKAMFWTVGHRWAAGARFAFNCYRHQALLILRRRGDSCYTLLSEEGVTQGDPLAMVLYGIAMCPLAERLQAAVPEVIQPWYADDAAMAGKASKVRKAMKLLQRWGPDRGYFPEPDKSIVICLPAQRERCQHLLRNFQFRYKDGHRYVGGYLGTDAARHEWIDPQIQKWVSGIKKLSKVALRYPQTAYAGLAKSLQSEWMYLQRVTDQCGDAFAPIDKAIEEDFLPALFGAKMEDTAAMRPLLALSVRRAGLGIPVPSTAARQCYDTSKACTGELVRSLVDCKPLNVLAYMAENSEKRLAARKTRGAAENIIFDEMHDSSSRLAKRQMLRAKEAGTWLTTMPNRLNGTELSAEEFRDSLRLRFGLQPTSLPATCDGCYQRFTVGHALSCKTGGLVRARHEEVAQEWHHLCAQAFTESAVSDEPLIPTSRDRLPVNAQGHREPVPEQRGDISCRGFWKRGTTAIFDVRITDTDQPSYLGTAPAKVLSNMEKEKKDKYLEACLSTRRQFTPLVFSVDGLAGAEAKAAMKRLSSRLSAKWKRAYSAVCGFVRSRLAFAVVRGSNRCIRGDRDPTARHPTFTWDSGSGLSLY
jgi:hypothetical protein